MTSFLIWLVVVEALGLAVAPLAFCALSRLPDRGYGLSKILGVLLVTFLNYLFGSTFGLGNNALLLGVAMILVCGLGVFALGEERARLGVWLREHRTAIIAQEALFIGLFALWTIVRANHPAVLSTEKPMDLAMMTASHNASSFPPYDPWMAGTTINYYYGGYLAIGTLVTLSGVLPAVGYNLGVALTFALVGLGVYSLMYNLTRSVVWALLAPVFTILIGNLDWLHQVMSASSQPGANAFSSFSFWTSSRVVDPLGDQGKYPATITEFPAFSFVLGDLHPHVIALPFTVLSAGVALNLALAPAAGWEALGANHLRRALALIVASIAVGALYFDNSWDWPSYLLLVMAGLLIPGLRGMSSHLLGQAAGLALGVAILSYLLFVQFRSSFQPQYNAVGFKLHGSLTGEVFTMFGLFFIPVGLFLVAMLAVPTLAVGGRTRAGAIARTGPRPEPRATSDPDKVKAVSIPAARRSTRTGATETSLQVDVEDDEWDDDLPRLPTLRGPRRRRGTMATTANSPTVEPPVTASEPASLAGPPGSGGEWEDGAELPFLPIPSLASNLTLAIIGIVLILTGLIWYAAGGPRIVLLVGWVILGFSVYRHFRMPRPKATDDASLDDEDGKASVDTAAGLLDAGAHPRSVPRPATHKVASEHVTTRDDVRETPPGISSGLWRRLLAPGGLILGALLSWGFFALLGIGNVGLLLPFAGVALYLAWREGSAGRNGAALACLLCAGGLLLVIACDVVFLKDNFCYPDASGACTYALYRMNTVFKLYYQAWTLLSLGAVYGLWALSRSLRIGWRRAVAPTLAALLVLFGAPYIPLSLFADPGYLDAYTNPVSTTNPTLDASAFLSQYAGQPITITNALPNDYAAILWLRANVTGHPTILEANDDPSHHDSSLDYEPFPGETQKLVMYRISTFTGLASVLGSGESHEGLWHGGQAATNTFYNQGVRTTDIRTMYTSTDLATVGADLAKYGVTYVYFGGAEDYIYCNNNRLLVNAAIDRFKRLHYKVVYNLRGVTILRL